MMTFTVLMMIIALTAIFMPIPIAAALPGLQKGHGFIVKGQLDEARIPLGISAYAFAGLNLVFFLAQCVYVIVAMLAWRLPGSAVLLISICTVNIILSIFGSKYNAEHYPEIHIDSDFEYKLKRIGILQEAVVEDKTGGDMASIEEQIKLKVKEYDDERIQQQIKKLDQMIKRLSHPHIFDRIQRILWAAFYVFMFISLL